MEPLPDFLQLSDDDLEREKQRQDRLRRDFNSRVKQAPVQEEMARAMILEESLQTSLTNADADIRDHIADRLADNLAAQGRFVEAATTASNEDLRTFYKKAAEAIYDNSECACDGKIESVGQTRIQLPKYRVLKEIYSLKSGQFGFLVECNACGQWNFLANDPLPERNESISDLELLKV